MFNQLTLTDFKSYREAALNMGPLTLVVGSNASGKSNLRDALRFLHAIGRGYTLPEILGQKYGEGGYREWSGLRGGPREACRMGCDEFSLGITLQQTYDITYQITVHINGGTKSPQVMSESLYWGGDLVFDSHPSDDPPSQDDQQHLKVRLPRGGDHRKLGPIVMAIGNQPVLSQMVELARQKKVLPKVQKPVEAMLVALESMRFVDFVPDVMRQSSLPGQTVLGDQGENLSSVLLAICEKEGSKRELCDWVKELTPMDVVDFDFPVDHQGRTLVYLVERGGRKISAHSASDGTLRFLGVLATLLGTNQAKFYFIEEIDNGIHPARLHLLYHLLRTRTAKGLVQVFSSTHSPQLLRLMSQDDLPHVSLSYRVEGVDETRLKALPDIPQLKELIEKQDIARLYEGGWMEQALFFDEGHENTVSAQPERGEQE